MAVKHTVPSSFARSLWLTIGMLAALVFAFTFYIWSEKKIDRANEMRHQSFLLANELRQSSDDLTRMVRTYVATGNPIYKKHYQDILDIRNGKKLRPEKYQQIYWDLVMKDGKPPRADSHQAIALLDLIRQAGFTEQEFRKLAKANANSDDLTNIERDVMKLVETTGLGAEANRTKALLMLYDEKYHQSKAAIMQPINEVNSMMDERTLNAVHAAETIATILRVLLVVFVCGLILTLRRTYLALKSQLGGSVEEVQAQIAKIGNGDFSPSLVVTDDMQDSVLGWLAKKQTNFIEMDRERKQAERYEKFRSRILELLAGDESLHSILKVIVRGVEKLNPAMLCSVLLLDSEGRRFAKGIIAPSLPDFYNAAMDGIEIGMGVGSCGTAAIICERVIVDDIASHPYWADYKELAAKAGLGACWSQPIRSSSGQVLGTFAIYHHEARTPTNSDIYLIEQSARLASIAIERRLAEQNLRIAAIAFESQEGMLVTDANRVILRVNRAFTRITGYTEKEVIGKHPGVLSSGRHDVDFYAEMWESINRTGAWEGEVWNRRKNGEVYPEYLTFTVVKDSDGIVMNYVATLIDITLRKTAAEEIQQLAFYDPLTGLPNRRLLMDRLKQALASSARGDRNGALLFIDLDHFKTLNDTLGHDVGDLLLQQVAERLTSCVREADTVARLGGDEYVVVLEKLGASTFEVAAQVEIIGAKILAALNQPYQLASHEYHNTPSIGVTLFSGHELGVDELLKQADIAMYQAKMVGRNALRFFDPLMQDAINTRADLERELRKALGNQQFQLYYQIQVDNLGHALGAEALIRWIHPERGMVSPLHFIPLAEDTGLILPIGQWVLETACAQLKRWQQSVLTRDLVLSVNVSAKQFRQADFVAQVQAAVQRHAINPTLLKLELTESLLLENVEDVIATMSLLKGIGVRFALDDFGTGYSSLQYLKRLPLDQLKIDQSFVRDIISDSSDQAIVHTIISMAQSLNLDIIAEGVEAIEQRQFLLNRGCMSFQGYLFGRPVPIMQFEASLEPD
jgi:diguanylate cyclase (GGDEF)-like protein/PAS domain S-box-containing protein